jgi:hypothetical protein
MFGIFAEIIFAFRMKPENKILHTSDIQRVLGVSVRTAQRRMQELKKKMGKEKHHLITFSEFMRYYHVNI